MQMSACNGMVVAVQTLLPLSQHKCCTEALQAPQPHKEDVRQHLQQLRRQVLLGVHLVFSHVIPLEQDMTQHPLWRLATQVWPHRSPSGQSVLRHSLLIGENGFPFVMVNAETPCSAATRRHTINLICCTRQHQSVRHSPHMQYVIQHHCLGTS